MAERPWRTTYSGEKIGKGGKVLKKRGKQEVAKRLDGQKKGKTNAGVKRRRKPRIGSQETRALLRVKKKRPRNSTIRHPRRNGCRGRGGTGLYDGAHPGQRPKLKQHSGTH